MKHAMFMTYERINFQLSRANVPLTTSSNINGWEAQLNDFRSMCLEIYPMLIEGRDYVPNLVYPTMNASTDMRYEPRSGFESDSGAKKSGNANTKINNMIFPVNYVCKYFLVMNFFSQIRFNVVFHHI